MRNISFDTRTITMSSPADNLQQLEAIEQQISSALQSAGLALMELSKDKPSVRQVENHSTNYMKALDAIENGLSTHINYLTQCSTGQPHEGSGYAAQKDFHMARFRWEHVNSRLIDLEKLKTEHLRQESLQRSRSQTGQMRQDGIQRSVSQNIKRPTSLQTTQQSASQPVAGLFEGNN